MSDVFAVADRLVSHIKSTCCDEVDLVAYYGSHAQGVATESSDLDFFYVPRPGFDPDIARSFLLADRLFDFWPLSWQTLSGFATGALRGWAFAPGLVYHARILHARNGDIAAQLADLKGQTTALQQEAARPQMVRRALRQFADVQAQMEELRQLAAGRDMVSMRHASWLFIEALWECLALANQVFFDRGLSKSLALVQRFELRPADMEVRIDEIINSENGERVAAAGEDLMRGVREVLFSLQQSLPAVSIAAAFAGAYPELKDALKKVVAACRAGERAAALAAAWSAQRELDGLLAATLYGAVDMRFNRHGEVAEIYRWLDLPEILAGDPSDLGALARVVENLDEKLRALLAVHGVELNEYGDLRALEQVL